MAFNVDNFYRQVEAASRLPSTYQNVGNLRSQSGSPFWEGFADARNAVTDIGRQIENARDRKRYEEMRRKAESEFGANNPTPPEQTIGQTYNTQYDPNQTITMENNPINNSFGTAIGSVISAGQVPQDKGYDYSLPYRQGENPPDYTFQNAMPTEQNGYHLGSYPQTEMYGDPKDWQRQMVRNELYHGQKAEGTGDNTMNIRDQGIGQNYNQRINSQVGSFYPQAPNSNVNSFGKILGDNAITVNPNFQNPSSDNQTAQPTGGVSIGADGFNNPNIIGRGQVQQQNPYNADYTFQQWLEDDRARGVTNPVISALRYQTFIEPMKEESRKGNIRSAIAVLQDPDIDEQTKMKAYATLAIEMGDPFFRQNREMKEDEFYAKQGLMRNPNYSDGDSEYGGDDENARTIYSHLASKGVPANVIAGIMGNLQAESGFNSSAVGDGGQSIGLAQWYDSRGNNLRNFAKQRGKEWNDIGTQVDFLLNEIQQSNPDLLQRMAKLSPHEAAILFHDEFEKSADTPEMKARRGEYASNIFNGRRQNSKYVRDPNYVSPREKFDAEQAYKERIARAREYKAYGDPTKNTVDVRLPKVKATSPQDYSDAVNAYSSADIPSVEQTHKIGQAFAPEFQEYISHFNGNVEQALKQMYYDKNADGGKGYSMSPQKLARAIAAASAYAQGVPPNKFDGYMNDAANYLVSSFSGNQQTSPENKSGGQEGNNNIIKPEVGKPNGKSNSSWSFSNMFGGIGNVAKKAKEGGAIGTSDVGDVWDSATSNFMKGVERDRQERRDKEKEEERKRFNSLR